MAMGPFEEQVIDVDLQTPAPGKKLPHAIMSRNKKNLVMSDFSILDVIDYGSHESCGSDH